MKLKNQITRHDEAAFDSQPQEHPASTNTKAYKTMLQLTIKRNIIIRRGPIWRRGVSGINRWSPEAQQQRNHVDTLIDTNPPPTTSTLLLLHQSQHHIEGMYMNSATVMDYILSNVFNSMHIAEAIGTLAMDHQQLHRRK